MNNTCALAMVILGCLAISPSRGYSADADHKPQSLFVLRGRTDWVVCLCVSPDGKFLASGSEDGKIRLWELATGKNTATLEGHSDEVVSLAFSPDGKTLASGSKDNTIKLWEPSTGKTIATLKGHTDWVNSVAFSPDSKTLASGGGDNTIKLWDIATAKNIGGLEGHAKYGITSVAFSPDGKTLAFGVGGGSVTLWDMAAKCTTLLDEDQEYATPVVTFSPDGKALAMGGPCIPTIRIWEVSTGKRIAVIDSVGIYGCLAKAYSSDGKTLAWISRSGGFGLWDIVNGKAIYTAEDGTLPRDDWCAAFFADGKIVAAEAETRTNSITAWKLPEE